MAKTITLTIPHRLSQDEARQRIQTGIEDARRKFGGQIGQLEDHWTGNHVEAQCKVLGQTITGRADVQPDRVVINIDLPWLLSKLVGSIQPQIEAEARRRLGR